MNKIGVLKRIRRYPVKSMMGQELDKIYVDNEGLIGDRVYAFIDETNTSSFPWMTARQKHEMILFKTSFKENKEGRDKVTVTTPEEKDYDINDIEFEAHLEDRFGRPLRLKYSKKGYYDSKMISIFNIKTISLFEKETGLSLDPVRYRANFYVDFPEALYEEKLVGKKLKIGETLVVTVIKQIKRCVITTLDTKTGEKNMDILKNVAKNHDLCAGIYAEVLHEGEAKAEDEIFLLE